MLAQVSPTYYAYLEQGRDVTPSPAVLDGIARGLGLEPVEHRYLLALAAGTHDARSARPALAEPERRIVKELVAATDSAGWPVYALDGNGEVVAGNAHLEDWYGPIAIPDGSTNFLRWFFTNAAKERLADWEADASELVARVRYHAASPWMGPHGWATVDDLLVTDSDFARMWRRHDVTDQEPAVRRFRRPDGSESTLRLIPTRPAPSPMVSIVMHLPDNGL